MITAIFTLLSALYDNGKRFTDHTSRWIFRAIVVCLISCFPEGNFIGNLALNTAIFYGIFDYVLNILEKRKWNYIGDTAIIDQFINKYGNWKIQFLFKILLIILTFVLKFKII
jgi:hypothetical protein